MKNFIENNVSDSKFSYPLVFKAISGRLQYMPYLGKY